MLNNILRYGVCIGVQLEIEPQHVVLDGIVHHVFDDVLRNVVNHVLRDGVCVVLLCKMVQYYKKNLI